VTTLDRYNKLTAPAMMALALIYTGIFTVQSIIFQPQAQWYILLNRVSLAVWAVFAIDLAITFVLDPNKRSFPRRNILNIVTVVLPMFRALRILRIFTGGVWVSRKGNGILTRSAIASAVAATVLICFIGSLMILNAERGASKATIVSFWDAMWWSAETVTTVGYGDLSPVTGVGRVIAVLLMIGGISLVGVVTATLASWIIQRVAEEETANQALTAAGIDALRSDFDQRLDKLSNDIERLTQRLGGEVDRPTDPRTGASRLRLSSEVKEE
jgi:voltage-gated potassium channel